MRIPIAIIEDEGIADYLIKRWLLLQYKKAKTYILHGACKQSDFKQREPKSHTNFCEL